MALSMFHASTAFVAPQLTVGGASLNVRMETTADLEVLAKKLNPTIGFYDPLGLVKSGVKREEESTTIGWLRHAEIKHGRVAMAAFVGFIVQSNGICFPWALTGGEGGVSFSDIAAAGGPKDQWDALPTAAKVQILMFIGFLEFYGELTGRDYLPGSEKHYVYGGKPGAYPSFGPLKASIGHPLFDLFDPFGFSKNKTPEQKERGLLIELNNGRAAQLGIFAFISASKGLMVPGFDSIAGIKPYAGEYMAPFVASDSSLPFVTDMLANGIKVGNLVPDLY